MNCPYLYVEGNPAKRGTDGHFSAALEKCICRVHSPNAPLTFALAPSGRGEGEGGIEQNEKTTFFNGPCECKPFLGFSRVFPGLDVFKGFFQEHPIRESRIHPEEVPSDLD